MAYNGKCEDCKKQEMNLKAFSRTIWPEPGEPPLQPGAEWFTETKYICKECAKKYED